MMKSIGLVLKGNGTDQMSVFEPNDPVLLFRADGRMLPLYVGAFQIGDGWPFRIVRKYESSFFINADGEGFVIDKIESIGLFGEGLFKKSFSLLNLNWSYCVTARPASFDFDWIKEKVVNGLSVDPYWESVFGKDIDVVRSGVKDARLVLEIFKFLRMLPDDDDQDSPVLDLL